MEQSPQEEGLREHSSTHLSLHQALSASSQAFLLLPSPQSFPVVTLVLPQYLSPQFWAAVSKSCLVPAVNFCLLTAQASACLSVAGLSIDARAGQVPPLEPLSELPHPHSHLKGTLASPEAFPWPELWDLAVWLYFPPNTQKAEVSCGEADLDLTLLNGHL